MNKSGRKDIETIGSYVKLRNVTPDFVISSCALQAQQTAEILAEKMQYPHPVEYLNELYLSDTETFLHVLSTQKDNHESILLIAHNPTITELVKFFIKEPFEKFPTLGVMALKLNINSWKEISQIRKKAKVDFFIFPKQFKYYMPLQIQNKLRSDMDKLV